MLILNLSISEFLDQIPTRKDMKEAFPVNLQIKNLFLLKIKIKQKPGCQIRNITQSLSSFIRISGSIPEVKNPALIIDWENIACWEESE